jgi:plastocyanin
MESRTVVFVRFSMVVVLLGVLLAGAAAQAVADPAAAKLVPVVLQGGADDIVPANAQANQGDTIAWLNMGPGPVTIKFITRIGLACAAPSNFYSDLLGNYETSAIAPGGTASICLLLPGEYMYEVRRLSEKNTEKPLEIISTGKITCVKK